MFQENDYITRQIKTMVKGLGKFMGLEQIKEFLNLSSDEQSTITDDELESIITTSKIEIISENKGLTKEELATELDMTEDELNQLMSHEIIASEESLNQMMDYINENQAFM